MAARRALFVAAALLVACVPFSAGSPAWAAPDDPGRFEILQSAFYAFTQPAPTHQGFSERCVVLEQFAGSAGEPNSVVRGASDTMLANTTRDQFVVAEYHLKSGASADALGTDYGTDRFNAYYLAALVPTAIFDGTGRLFEGGPQTPEHYQAAYDAASGRDPGASINASGAIVLNTGFVNFEVFSPYNLSTKRVVLRGAIVEDPVPAPGGAGTMRFVVRAGLSGATLDLTGDTTIRGRINFSVEPSWIESRLGAVLMVQSDGLKAGLAPPPAPGADLLSAVLVPVAVLVAGVTLAVIVARFVTSERRARLR